jgi:methyl-accepting chemotaxis protein
MIEMRLKNKIIFTLILVIILLAMKYEPILMGNNNDTTAVDNRSVEPKNITEAVNNTTSAYNNISAEYDNLSKVANDTKSAYNNISAAYDNITKAYNTTMTAYDNISTNINNPTICDFFKLLTAKRWLVWFPYLLLVGFSLIALRNF